MVERVRRIHPALKHGGYSATALLPGEDPAAFKKLHQDLIAEFNPSGALEDDIVATMSRLVWRKQHLSTFRIAELARDYCGKLQSEERPESPLSREYLADYKAAEQAADGRARHELGDSYALVELGDTAKVGGLIQGLEVEDRLDSMIDRCLKRLLFVRGLKTLPAASSSPPRPLPRPSKAA
jgi:hypothetical protein